MTKDEKLADTVWYYIEEYVASIRRAAGGEGSLKSVANEAKRLDRALRQAIRSK